jgi:hypothetical protein
MSYSSRLACGCENHNGLPEFEGTATENLLYEMLREAVWTIGWHSHGAREDRPDFKCEKCAVMSRAYEVLCAARKAKAKVA